jgi:hypothetical protein
MEDQESIRRSRQGDVEAFNFLVGRYQKEVLNFAFRMLGNLPDAEDVCQDSWLEAWKTIRRFKGGSFRSWILHIVASNCRDEFRRRKKRASISETDTPPLSIADPKRDTALRQESDLYIRANANLKRKAERLVIKYRTQLEKYIERHPNFLTSLEPVSVPSSAPRIVRQMAESGEQAKVGPWSAVAGAIAEFVGQDLLAFTPEVIIENGGDIYIKSLKKRVVGIYAGKSPLTGKIGIEIEPDETPIGVSTSSGTVGHSLSFGKADAVTVVANSAILSDAAATAICNLIQQPSGIAKGIEFARSIKGLKGILIIIGENVGLWGHVKICQTTV